MSGDPLVSVIVPIYNAKIYMGRCLDSITGQTYRNLEILLIDDGSTDDSAELCRRYAQKDGRIRLFRQENRGQAAARNVGLDHMRGDYLTFVDADDYIDRSYVELLLRGLTEENVPLAVCAYDKVYAGEADRGASFYQGPVPHERFSRDRVFGLMGNWSDAARFIIIGGKLYKRDIFSTLRFPAGRGCEDEFVFPQIYAQAEYVCHIPLPLYHYVQTPESTVRHNGACHIPKGAPEALLRQLEYFQGYGKRRYIRLSAVRLLMLTKALCEQSGLSDQASKERMSAARTEIRRITHRRVISPKYDLYALSPALYRRVRAVYRRICGHDASEQSAKGSL